MPRFSAFKAQSGFVSKKRKTRRQAAKVRLSQESRNSPICIAITAVISGPLTQRGTSTEVPVLLIRKTFHAILIPMLSKTKKTKIVKNVQVHETDTGSPEVQIAILTERIDELATHLKKNAKDNHSRRGLLQMVADRKAHMKYLEKKNPKRYGALLKKIGLKK